LVEAGRACTAFAGDTGERLWLAAENIELVRQLYSGATFVPAIILPDGAAFQADREEARLRLLRGQMEATGPTTAAALAVRVRLTEKDVDFGLRALEAAGHVLRGRFTAGAEADEFCDRRLLARIHRYTLDRLRKEIDPVTAQDFMRFLFRWHHLTEDTRLEGKVGVRQAIALLEGFETAAAAWEPELLSSRVNDYRASWLDELSLGGEAAWARLTPRKSTATNAPGSPTRQTPITIAQRNNLAALLLAVRGPAAVQEPSKGAAAEIYELLSGRGALFLEEIVSRTRRLRTDVERGLRELVARGLITADGFQGLRQLTGGARRDSRRALRSLGNSLGFFAGSAPAGRWTLLHAPEPGSLEAETIAEDIARILLGRYGVVFRDVVSRESITLPWRDLLRALRRMEARGVVRGGRFITCFAGEQYALPEAVDALRRVRRQERQGEQVIVCATDPLNLTGIILPGAKVPAQIGTRLVFVDGLPVTVPEPRSALRAAS
jgi:ATP-dependent Lhr-like helicase